MNTLIPSSVGLGSTFQPPPLMKSSLLRVLVLALALGCSTVHATLIGDTITVTHYYPDLGTVLLTQDTLVATGTGDSVTQHMYYSVNPEASSILVDFVLPGGPSPSAFNGLVVSGIDDIITGVTVSTNLAGWSDSRLAFDAHSVSANWQGLWCTADSFFNVFFDRSLTHPTPDGGTTAALLGLAVLALAAIRRRIS